MNKKVIVLKRLIIICLFIVILVGFYSVNSMNYLVHVEIKQNLIEHPEGLPSKETAKNSAFGFKNLSADFFWLKTIQYIGGNAISSEYKKYLFPVLDIITELNPYFEHPYVVGELLLPSYNQRYEDLSIEQQDIYTNLGKEIGLKGMKNFCDQEKLELIRDEEDLNKIANDDKFKNPCKSYLIPYYLAYIEYFYNFEPLSSSYYYKVTSAIETAPSGAKVMASIMQGKGGNREKSYKMFVNIAKSIEGDELCSEFANELEKVGNKLFEEGVEISADFVRNVGGLRDKVFGKFEEEDEGDLLADTKCSNYVNKAVRELNLYYIEKNNEKFKLENDNTSARNAEVLYEDGYIEYLPIDFQQYEGYGIIYIFNPETGGFDYEMGNYR